MIYESKAIISPIYEFYFFFALTIVDVICIAILPPTIMYWKRIISKCFICTVPAEYWERERKSTKTGCIVNVKAQCVNGPSRENVSQCI